MVEELKAPECPPEVERLKHMTDVTINANVLAPAVRMHPSVMIKYAKEGTWPTTICNYIISGNRVKFFREDFLQKAGYLPKQDPEKTILEKVLEELAAIRLLLENRGGVTE